MILSSNGATTTRQLYSSLEELNPTTSRDERKAVLAVLRSRADSWVTASDIAKHTGLESGSTQVKVRKVIAELIEFQQQPIVSSTKGFMWTQDIDRLLRYRENLLARIRGIEHRVSGVSRVLNSLRAH